MSAAPTSRSLRPIAGNLSRFDRSDDDRQRDGAWGPTRDDWMAFRRRLDWLSRTRAAWQARERTDQPWWRMGRVRLQESVRLSRTPDQRRRHAGSGQL